MVKNWGFGIINGINLKITCISHSTGAGWWEFENLYNLQFIVGGTSFAPEERLGV
jgi:hypothetical protein